MEKETQTPKLPQNAVITGALISLTNFLSNHLETGCAVTQIRKLSKYADLLKKPITLGMFVPTDKNGKVLQLPEKYKNWINYNYSGTDIGFEDEKKCREYDKAKKLVLFANFEVKTKTAFNNGYDFVCDNNEIFYPFWYNPVTGWELSKGLKTIEDLVIFQPKLTDNVLSEYFS